MRSIRLANMKENQLTQGKVGPALLRFALPFLIASFLQQLYGTVDTAAVGRLSANAAAELSAVSTGAQVTFSFTTVVMGIATGGTVLIGQYSGADQRDNISRIIGTMFPVFGVLGLLLTVISWPDENGSRWSRGCNYSRPGIQFSLCSRDAESPQGVPIMVQFHGTIIDTAPPRHFLQPCSWDSERKQNLGIIRTPASLIVSHSGLFIGAIRVSAQITANRIR